MGEKNSAEYTETDRKVFASFESPDYLQRIEDDEQERYLAQWSREHQKKHSEKS